MKTVVLILSFCIIIFSANGQLQDATQLHETGKKYMNQGDYTNASVALSKAFQQAPSDIEIAKDLSLTLYFQRKNERALETIQPFVDKGNADEESFRIAGNIYKALGNTKECEKLYKKGLKKFPSSGRLYNDYGELLWNAQDANAIKQWEKGIEFDPDFAGNYYNASKYYYQSADKIWSIIYGEIFINVEPATGRAAEIKNILLDSYKKFFTDDILNNLKSKNNFEQAFMQTMNKQAGMAAYGIDPETLTMIRTRFILDWFENYSAKFPFKLFEYHRQLLREGLFDAYNQSIFGAAQNLGAYQNWVNANPSQYDDLIKFQKERLFKVARKQYYHK